MLRSIEFLGMPGAGKSRALKHVAAWLRRQGKGVYSLDEAAYRALRTARSARLLRLCARLFPYRIGYHLLTRFPRTADDLGYLAFQRFLLAHPALAQMVLDAHYQPNRTVAQFNFLSLFWFFNLFSKYQLVTEELASTDAFILFDEGFSQRVVTLFGYGQQPEISDDAITSYLANIPCPQIIFVLQASVDAVESRMNARGYPLRMQSMTAPEREQCLQCAAACVALTVERLRQSEARLIELDNNGTEADLLIQVQHALHTLAIAL